MHPAGKVHLTSGVLPRKALQLARDWVQPGLAVIAPSVRVGPVLVDADAIRLPKDLVVPKGPDLDPPRHALDLEKRPDSIGDADGAPS